ncbi:MAG: hypothetical protein GY741_02530 [Phycisphaeraceae bacterium]|nr:hypothetical protein [Deltaproteobacteria bacterium]MCP4067139.1 hypothetical protein [Phycisphaeraceae bacterium]
MEHRWRRIAAAFVGAGLVGFSAFAPSGVGAQGGESAKKAPTIWHATAFVRGRVGIRVIDYWSKGSNMRARTLIAGHPITTIVRGDLYLVLDGLTGRGLEIRRSKEAIGDDAKRIRPFALEFEDLIRDGGEKIEEVEIGAVKAEVWRVTDSSGRRKLWVTTGDLQVPLRIETFNRASADTFDLDYSGWAFDLELGADFFSTPAGFEMSTFEYDDYLTKSIEGPVSAVPILYPDLLHGNQPR